MRFIILRYIFCIGVLMANQNIEEGEELGEDQDVTDMMGRSAVDLVFSRSRESNLGNFVTDAMFNAFKNESKISIIQSKLLEYSEICKGDVTLDLIKSMSGQSFNLVNTTGLELMSILEESVANFDVNGVDTSGDFLQVSGVQVEFDLTQDVGKRVTSALLCCQERHPVDPDEVYRIVVASNTIANTNNKNAITAIQDFIQSFPNQTIPSSRYKKTECRSWVKTKNDKNRENLIYFLLAVMALSGFLTVIANITVIYVGFNTSKKIFENSILSLAFVDLLTGVICTPSVSIIYYHSKYNLQ